MLQELGRWLKGFDRTTLQKGKGYFEEGLAEVDYREHGWIKAKVHGSRKTPYEVHLKTRNNGDILATCSCPVGYRCKHMVASALEGLKLLAEQM